MMPSVLQHGSGAGLPAIRFDPGIALLVEGESTGKLYILVDGEIEVLRGDTRVMIASRIRRCEPIARCRRTRFQIEPAGFRRSRRGPVARGWSARKPCPIQPV